MWAVVDSGLGSWHEVSQQWSLAEYMHAVDYLRHKQERERQAAQQAQSRRG